MINIRYLAGNCNYCFYHTFLYDTFTFHFVERSQKMHVQCLRHLNQGFWKRILSDNYNLWPGSLISNFSMNIKHVMHALSCMCSCKSVLSPTLTRNQTELKYPYDCYSNISLNYCLTCLTHDMTTVKWKITGIYILTKWIMLLQIFL